MIGFNAVWHKKTQSLLPYGASASRFQECTWKQKLTLSTQKCPVYII